MSRDPRHSRRRALCLYLPAALTGGALYAPHAAAMNSATLLGLALMATAALAALTDTYREGAR